MDEIHVTYVDDDYHDYDDNTDDRAQWLSLVDGGMKSLAAATVSWWALHYNCSMILNFKDHVLQTH